MDGLKKRLGLKCTLLTPQRRVVSAESHPRDGLSQTLRKSGRVPIHKPAFMRHMTRHMTRHMILMMSTSQCNSRLNTQLKSITLVWPISACSILVQVLLTALD